MNKLKFFLLSCLLLITACSVDPVTKSLNLNFYSEQDEIKMGEEYHPILLSEYGEYKDESLQKYLQEIVDQIKIVSHRPQLNYRVTILDTMLINAFAIPGGNVYVCRGILPYLNSEAELAAVLAHEIGHVNARHSVEQQSNKVMTNIGVSIGSLFFKNRQQAKIFYNLGSGAALLTQLSYSRENEMEADRLSVEYTHKADFSPLGTEKVMKMFERLGSGKDKSLEQSLLSTHPVSAERSKQARVEVRKLAKEEYIKQELHRDRYLGAISGLYLGESAQKGTILENVYYNQKYNFKFLAVQDFELALGEEYLFSYQRKDSKQAMFLTIQEKSGQEENSQNLDKTIGSKPVKTITNYWQKYPYKSKIYIQKDSDNNPIQISHLAIDYGQHFINIILLEKNSTDLPDSSFGEIMLRQLNILTKTDLLKLQQHKLVIYHTKPSDTWESLAKKNFPQNDSQRLAWANGCELSDPLPKQIKLFLF